jgi:NAD(P)H-dependent nitrite reductase small subunit
MAEFVEVCNVVDIPAGTGKMFEIGREEIGVFNVEGTFYAIDNLCPHEGGPMADGPVKGNIVTCPLHGWQCNVITGESLELPGVKVPIFEVKAENGKIYIKV